MINQESSRWKFFYLHICTFVNEPLNFDLFAGIGISSIFTKYNKKKLRNSLSNITL